MNSNPFLAPLAAGRTDAVRYLTKVAAMPKGPPQIVRDNIEKCRSSAIAAVDAYNRPGPRFRTAQFIILIIIAWTALFHAILYRRRRRPWFRKPGSGTGVRYVKIDGEPKHWDLIECLRQYFEDKNPPERKNLEFLIRAAEQDRTSTPPKARRSAVRRVSGHACCDVSGSEGAPSLAGGFRNQAVECKGISQAEYRPSGLPRRGGRRDDTLGRLSGGRADVREIRILEHTSRTQRALLNRWNGVPGFMFCG